MELLKEIKMITWLRDLIFGKDYVKTESVNSQITDAVTTKPVRKTTAKKTTVKKTSGKTKS